tara:strand:+ start:165 stop:326 length:162 start_codon:yes stop_codon:yes gene_type:complete
MFIFLLFGILIGIYVKETMQIPRLQPYVDKLFSKQEQPKPPEKEKEKEKENAS